MCAHIHTNTHTVCMYIIMYVYLISMWTIPLQNRGRRQSHQAQPYHPSKSQWSVAKYDSINHTSLASLVTMETDLVRRDPMVGHVPNPTPDPPLSSAVPRPAPTGQRVTAGEPALTSRPGHLMGTRARSRPQSRGRRGCDLRSSPRQRGVAPLVTGEVWGEAGLLVGHHSVI